MAARLRPPHPQLSRTGGIQPPDNVEQGRFAGAGTPNQGDEFPRLDGERNPAQSRHLGLALLIVLVEIDRFNQCGQERLLFRGHTHNNGGLFHFPDAAQAADPDPDKKRAVCKPDSPAMVKRPVAYLMP